MLGAKIAFRVYILFTTHRMPYFSTKSFYWYLKSLQCTKAKNWHFIPLLGMFKLKFSDLCKIALQDVAIPFLFNFILTVHAYYTPVPELHPISQTYSINIASLLLHMFLANVHSLCISAWMFSPYLNWLTFSPPSKMGFCF